MLIPHQKLTPRIRDFVFGSLNYLIRRKNEKLLRKYIPQNNVYWTGSGRSALFHILKENDVKRVGLPAFTCTVVLDACKQAGCKVEFIDASYVLKLEDLDKIDKIDALAVPYNFGFMADIDKIRRLCRLKQVLLIEDCAQALGAKYNNKLAGSFGDFAFYSFGISKNIGYLGGMVSSDKEIKIRQKRYPFWQFYKASVKAKASYLFFNPYIYPLFYSQFRNELQKPHDFLDYRMPCFARYVVLEQFKRYDKILELRKSNAEYCMRELDGVIDFIKPTKNSEPSWLYFVLLSKNRDQLRKALFKEHVDVQPLLTFKDLSRKGKLASHIEKEHLIFALYRPRCEIEYIVKKIKKVCDLVV